MLGKKMLGNKYFFKWKWKVGEGYTSLCVGDVNL